MKNHTYELLAEVHTGDKQLNRAYKEVKRTEEREKIAATRQPAGATNERLCGRLFLGGFQGPTCTVNNLAALGGIIALPPIRHDGHVSRSD